MDNDDRLRWCECRLEELRDYLHGTLTDDEAWLRIELGMLLHDLQIIKERDNG